MQHHTKQPTRSLSSFYRAHMAYQSGTSLILRSRNCALQETTKISSEKSSTPSSEKTVVQQKLVNHHPGACRKRMAARKRMGDWRSLLKTSVAASQEKGVASLSGPGPQTLPSPKLVGSLGRALTPSAGNPAKQPASQASEGPQATGSGQDVPIRIVSSAPELGSGSVHISPLTVQCRSGSTSSGKPQPAERQAGRSSLPQAALVTVNKSATASVEAQMSPRKLPGPVALGAAISGSHIRSNSPPISSALPSPALPKKRPSQEIAPSPGENISRIRHHQCVSRGQCISLPDASQSSIVIELSLL